MSLENVPSTAKPKPAHAVSVTAPPVLDGRRRPGRPVQVSPHLVSLLRSPTVTEVCTPLLSATEAKSFNEDLSIAKGFGVGILLAIPAWAAIGLVTWAVLR